MNKKQLVILFLIALNIGTVGGAVVALLPVYATRLGADSTLAGLYFSSAFAAVAAGTLTAGWLSDQLQRRKTLLLLATIVEGVAFWMMGLAANLGQLFFITFVGIFASGVVIAMVSTLAGLFAEESERGRVFGLLASANSLGNLIGGLSGGLIINRWGFWGLFTVAALVTFLKPIVGVMLQDKVVEPVRQNTGTTRSSIWSMTFVLLFCASTVAYIANGTQALGRSLSMDRLGFDTTAILSTVAVAGLMTLPFPILMGKLSDRIGRKPLLIICYLSNALSLIILAASGNLWHFWVSTALATLLGASLAIGSALVTDLVPQKALGSGLALFSASSWIGPIIGTAVTGAAFQNLGIVPTLISGAFLAIAGVIILIPVRRSASRNVMTNH